MTMCQSGAQSPLRQSTISVAYSPQVDSPGPLSADAVDSPLSNEAVSRLSGPCVTFVPITVNNPRRTALQSGYLGCKW